jgi:hypothetical protein
MKKTTNDPQKATKDRLPPVARGKKQREERLAELREQRDIGELLRAYHGLPWETESERTKFQYFLLCPRPRSVRKAYRLWCEDNGIEPKKDPPKSWYRAYRGDYAAFRKAER